MNVCMHVRVSIGPFYVRTRQHVYGKIYTCISACTAAWRYVLASYIEVFLGEISDDTSHARLAHPSLQRGVTRQCTVTIALLTAVCTASTSTHLTLRRVVVVMVGGRFIFARGPGSGDSSIFQHTDSAAPFFHNALLFPFRNLHRICSAGIVCVVYVVSVWGYMCALCALCMSCMRVVCLLYVCCVPRVTTRAVVCSHCREEYGKYRRMSKSLGFRVNVDTYVKHTHTHSTVDKGSIHSTHNLYDRHITHIL